MTTLDLSQLSDTELIEKYNELKAAFQTETNNDTRNSLNDQLGATMFEINQRN